jgi:hypothetical protein
MTNLETPTAEIPPTPPEEPKMEIHKPKAVHSWREFLKEYAIIVLGVITALLGEQAVEKLHDRARATEARASIREEIARNLGYMNVREASEACMTRRLDEVDGLIATSAAGKLPQEPLWIGQPVAFIMLDGKYKAAIQSGAVSLFDDGEQAAYTSLYAMFVTYWEQSQAEMRTWADLRTLEKHPPPSPVLDWQLRSAVQQARNDRFDIELTRQVALQDAAGMGVTPARYKNFDLPSPCIPLHTPREAGAKLVSYGIYKAPVP